MSAISKDELKGRVGGLLRAVEANKAIHAAYADAVVYAMTNGEFSAARSFVDFVRDRLARFAATEIEYHDAPHIISVSENVLVNAVERLESYCRTLELVHPIIAQTPHWEDLVKRWYQEVKRIPGTTLTGTVEQARFLMPIILTNPALAREVDFPSVADASRKRAAEAYIEKKKAKKARLESDGDPPSK